MMIIRLRYWDEDLYDMVEYVDSFEKFDTTLIDGKDVFDMHIYESEDCTSPLIHVDYGKNVTYLRKNGKEKHFHPNLNY